MSEGDPSQVRCTPTDPSIEFDVLEVVRLKLVETLTRGGYGALEAERVALYVVGCARPVSKLLKVLTGPGRGSQEQVLEALSHVLDEAPALEKARRIMHGLEEGAVDTEGERH
jgi:hypothetical protein